MRPPKAIPDGRYPASKPDMQFLKLPPNPGGDWSEKLIVQPLLTRSFCIVLPAETDGTGPLEQRLNGMTDDQETRAIARRERRIDEALSDSFPASDTPYFVGSGAVNPPAKAKQRNRSADMAGEAIDQSADLSASSEERGSRKRRMLNGPKEFRKFRRDHPT